MKSNACERAIATAIERDRATKRQQGREGKGEGGGGGGSGTDSRRYLLHSL